MAEESLIGFESYSVELFFIFVTDRNLSLLHLISKGNTICSIYYVAAPVEIHLMLILLSSEVKVHLLNCTHKTKKFRIWRNVLYKQQCPLFLSQVCPQVCSSLLQFHDYAILVISRLFQSCQLIKLTAYSNIDYN